MGRDWNGEARVGEERTGLVGLERPFHSSLLSVPFGDAGSGMERSGPERLEWRGQELRGPERKG